jgi:tellurite resistance protein TerC
LLPELYLWHWLGFVAFVVVVLTADLLVFHRHDHTPTLRESACWTGFWVGLALAFNVLIWWWTDRDDVGAVFLAGYLIEESLSMDNIFVFVVIFRFFGIPLMYQHRVLYWGILGAVVLRLAFILAGVELIDRFAWVIPVFGAFLIYTAYRLVTHGDGDVHPENNIILRTARRLFRVTHGDHREHGHDFFARQNGLLYITPMFLVLLVVESTDVLFAVDSVPAVIAVIIPGGYPKDWNMFLAFTSNVFAILGLRTLYFLLAGIVDLFRYLHYGLAGVLGFVGCKMIAEYFFAEKGEHLIPIGVSLGIIAVLLVVSILVSVVVASLEKRREQSGERKAESGEE